MNSHKFGLEGCDIYRVDLQFFYDHIIGPNVSSCYSNMRFFNTSVYDNNCTIMVYLK